MCIGEMLATHLLTYTFKHTLFDWLKYIWDPHNLMGSMWILIDQRECVEKCVLEDVFLAFLMCIVKQRYIEKPTRDPKRRIVTPPH